MREWTRVMALLAASSVVTVSLAAGVPAASAATATTTTLQSGPNPAAFGQPVTLTATVTGASPTGKVIFSEPGSPVGEAPLDVAGVASVVVTLPAGDHAITAQYVGDATNDASTSNTVTQIVTAPPPPPPPPPPVTPPPPPQVKKPAVHLKASAAKASVGDKVVLSWRSKRADTATASGDWGGAQKKKGHKKLRISERGKHVFKLTVENAAGRTTATVTVMATRKAKELELVVTDELVLVGTEVEVDADGLAKREPFTVRLAGKPVLTGKADKKGDVHGRFTLAKTTAEGVLELTITGSNPGRVGTAELSVIKPKELDLELGFEELRTKAEQTVAVIGLLPGESVTVSYGGKVLTTGEADAAGTFVHAFSVGKRTGVRTVDVTGEVASRHGEATFTVLAGSTEDGTPEGTPAPPRLRVPAPL